MRDNTQMLFMMEKLLPGSLPGADFQLTTVYAEDGVTVQEDSRITMWNLDMPQPTDEQINAHWTNTYSALWDDMIAANIANEIARKAKVVTDAVI